MKTLKTVSEPSPVPGGLLFLRWLLLFAYSFVVVLGAITPASKIPTFLSYFNDKAIHATEFFILMGVVLYSLSLENRKRRIVLAFIYCAAMGTITEWLQYFVPSRSMSFWDFIADTAGFSLAALLFYLFCKKGK